jgi:hypothetical protein
MKKCVLPSDFSEERYLLMNPDVANAVKSGAIAPEGTIG